MPTSPTISFYLLRGLAREIRHWGVFPSMLEGAKSNYQVIPLEIPGTGSLRNVKAPLNIAEYVDVIRSQYLQYASPRNINIIVGMSFGGMIAASWIASHTQDFSAAVLINTSCRHSGLFQRITPGGALQLLKSVFSTSDYYKERCIAELICNLANSHEVALQWAEIRKSSPVSALQAVRQLLCAASFTWPVIPDIPLLLLTSQMDRLVSPDCSKDIEQKTQSILSYHPTAGHDLPTDDPRWCVSAIDSWVDRRT